MDRLAKFTDVGPDVVVGQDLAENVRERRTRKREKDGRVGRGKESERTSERASDLCEREGAGKKKARTHQGAEIKKREQAGGKNSRFGICVSEAVQRRRQHNGGAPMSLARYTPREKKIR